MRYLCRRVILNNEEYGLSIVEIDGESVTIKPFDREIHSTSYVEGVIVIKTENGRLTLFVIN